jgi:hypothetical protein
MYLPFLYSFENHSPVSRHAFSLHVVDTEGCEWSKDNWSVHGAISRECFVYFLFIFHFVVYGLGMTNYVFENFGPDKALFSPEIRLLGVSCPVLVKKQFSDTCPWYIDKIVLQQCKACQCVNSLITHK